MQGTEPLTSKQKQTLDFINSFLTKNGYSPSLEEIAEHLGKKLSTAQYFVKELEEKGYLRKISGKARGIYPIPSPHSVPLLGFIAAGKPIEAIENPEEISVPKNIKIDSRHPHYALKVRGDSMMEMGILDKDVVLIKHQMTADNGDVIVGITEQGATLKVYKKKGNQILLEARNNSFPTIHPKELEIRGKFVGLIRHP